MDTSLSLTDGVTRLEVGPDGLRIYDEDRRQIVLDTHGGWPLLPVLQGRSVNCQFAGLRQESSGLVIELESQNPSITDVRLHLRGLGDSLELRSEFRVTEAASLSALTVFPSGTHLNLYEVVNFRNRHFTPAMWPELLLGQEVKTSTYSDDWQFAPHPTALVLRKDDLSLFFGFADLLPAFGFRLEAKRFSLERWEVDFGGEAHGLALSSGQLFQSGRLRIFSRRGQSPFDLYTEFGRQLVQAGAIPDPARKVREAWWQEPLYCTWGDQWMLGELAVAASLAEQTAASAQPAAEALTEDLLWRAVEVIRREGYPIRTILLDEGWAVARGDWTPHPQRLPRLRGIVDRLHALGFKVMVWWNWAEVAENAQVDSRHLAGGGWLNKHGCRWRDYSDPVVQQEYLQPLFRTLFSSALDCLDLDGVKTDFLADKVHPETPLHDPAWRGEENYFYQVTRLFYLEMKKHKPDACHLGCAGNYWLAEYIDANRTYDVHSSNWREHEERGRMLACTSPGAPVAYDMMTCTENTDLWFVSARNTGAGVEIGNLLNVRDDCLSSPRPADAAYYALLREGFRG